MPEEFACYLSLPANQGDDTVVLLPAERVPVSGDLFTNGNRARRAGGLCGGGRAKEWTTTLDGVLTLPFDTVVPMHGAVRPRADMVKWRDSTASLHTRVHQMRWES